MTFVSDINTGCISSLHMRKKIQMVVMCCPDIQFLTKILAQAQTYLPTPDPSFGTSEKAEKIFWAHVGVQLFRVQNLVYASALCRR